MTRLVYEGTGHDAAQGDRGALECARLLHDRMGHDAARGNRKTPEYARLPHDRIGLDTLSARASAVVRVAAKVETRPRHGCRPREALPAVIRAPSARKNLTAPRPVARTGIPAMGA